MFLTDVPWTPTTDPNPECTKIAHRRSLAIFIADEGIAGNSAARIIFTCLHRRINRGSLAVFFAEEIAHLGASKSRAIFPGAVKIAASTAENRAILVHSAPICNSLTLTLQSLRFFFDFLAFFVFQFPLLFWGFSTLSQGF